MQAKKLISTMSESIWSYLTPLVISSWWLKKTLDLGGNWCLQQPCLHWDKFDDQQEKRFYPAATLPIVLLTHFILWILLLSFQSKYWVYSNLEKSFLFFQTTFFYFVLMYNRIIIALILKCKRLNMFTWLEAIFNFRK